MNSSVIIIEALIFIFSLDNVWKGIAIGATQHIIFDQLVNVPLCRMDKYGYFLIFRLKNKFKKEKILRRQ